MELNLTRPLAVFDLETTGVNVGSDRIVEISILKVKPDKSSDTFTRRINPCVPIPPDVSKIHGIYDKDVVNEPTFKEIAPQIINLLRDCDLAGYNSNKFDLPILIEEFFRAGFEFDITSRKCIDIQNIFHKMEQRTLVAAYKFYCGKSLENAHSAEADTSATYEVLLAQLEKYPELKNDVDFLQKFTTMNNNVDLAGRIVFNNENKEVFNFGKHKGKTVEEVFQKEASYYNWMMDGDFTQQTKQVITAIRLRMKFPKS